MVDGERLDVGVNQLSGRRLSRLIKVSDVNNIQASFPILLFYRIIQVSAEQRQSTMNLCINEKCRLLH